MIDSVQTLYAAELGSAPGSVAQVREAASRLLRVAKESGIAVFLVGHVTKDGAVAGPRVLEHLVDCVLQFEGDRYRAHRILRAAKNRFGSTNEIGVFEMTGTGLVGVPDPSELFGRSEAGEIGAAVACALEGTRPILLEIQALVSPTDLAMPRRVATGVDPKRLAMIVAVLGRHARLALGSADVFVNVAGGVRIDEPGADLAIALAIASAARGVPVKEGMAAFGEIGLTGRLRVGDAGRAPARGVREARLRLGARPAGTPTARRSSRSSRPEPWPRRSPRGRLKPERKPIGRASGARVELGGVGAGGPGGGEATADPAIRPRRTRRGSRCARGRRRRLRLSSFQASSPEPSTGVPASAAGSPGCRPRLRGGAEQEREHDGLGRAARSETVPDPVAPDHEARLRQLAANDLVAARRRCADELAEREGRACDAVWGRGTACRRQTTIPTAPASDRRSGGAGPPCRPSFRRRLRPPGRGITAAEREDDREGLHESMILVAASSCQTGPGWAGRSTRPL